MMEDDGRWSVLPLSDHYTTTDWGIGSRENDTLSLFPTVVVVVVGERKKKEMKTRERERGSENKSGTEFYKGKKPSPEVIWDSSVRDVDDDDDDVSPMQIPSRLGSIISSCRTVRALFTGVNKRDGGNRIHFTASARLRMCIRCA